MADLSGQYLGRYYLLEPLGEGGMAVVYKAYDTRLEREVAIKIVRSGAFPADTLGEALKRFEREAKSLAKLSHPNIVKVHDFGEHEGSPYLVMEYLLGGTLKKLLEKPIPWRDAVRLILPIARGVSYAHQHGILHRDIKPANILITESGEPMLSDFGIAKLFMGEQATALTGSGMAIGTPEYMAPEQWNGETSPRSDLYSLGIVLYEMVAGRKPYVADTPAAILIKQATEPLPSPRKFATDLPEAVEFVLIKALAKNPEHRYQSMAELVNVFENLQNDGGGQSVIGTMPVGKKEKREHETAAREKEKRDRAEKAKHEKMERQADGKATLTKKLNSLKSTLNETTPFFRMASVIGFIIVALLAFLFNKMWTKLVDGPLAFSGTSAGEVNIYLYDAENEAVSLVDVGGGKNWDPAIAVSGNMYFTSNRDGKAEIYRLVNGRTERVTDTPGRFESWGPALSINEDIYFTSNRDGKAEIYRLVNGKIEHVTDTPGQFESWEPVFGMSGNIYFTSNRDGKAEIYRLVNGRIERVTNTPGRFESWGPALSINEDLYFTSNRDGKAEIYRLVNGKIERVTDTPGQFGSWSPILRGRVIYFTSNRSKQNEVYLLKSEVINIADMKSWTNILNERAPGY
jgi:serine/threonine protein kinase